MVAYLVYTEAVAGSSPATPTKLRTLNKQQLQVYTRPSSEGHPTRQVFMEARHRDMMEAAGSIPAAGTMFTIGLFKRTSSGLLEADYHGYRRPQLVLTDECDGWMTNKGVVEFSPVTKPIRIDTICVFDGEGDVLTEGILAFSRSLGHGDTVMFRPHCLKVKLAKEEVIEVVL